MTLQDQPVDELRGKIQDAVCPPSEHPTLGTMRLEDNAGIYRTGEFQIAGDFSNAISRLEKLIQAECNRARENDWKLYAEIINLYGSPTCNNLHHAKKYQHKAIESCPVENRIAELQQLMKGRK